MLPQTSLGTIGLIVGSILTIIGFIAYGTGNATLNLAGMFYGIPVLLGGLALKSSELKPVPYSQPTDASIITLRDKEATSIQNQIRKDVTRYRYAQKAHLDEALERLGLSPTDEERPLLVAIRETAVDDAYTLILEFDSPLIDLAKWQEKQEKITKFFGPGIRVTITQLENQRIDLALIREK